VRNLEFRVTAIGKTGHASIMFEGTAAEKLYYVINRLQGIRTEQLNLLKLNRTLNLGDVTSINLTMLEVIIRDFGGEIRISFKNLPALLFLSLVCSLRFYLVMLGWTSGECGSARTFRSL